MGALETIITVGSAEWSASGWTAEFAGCEASHPDARAQQVIAWLVLNTSAHMPGWSWRGGAFTGPMRPDTCTDLRDLVDMAVDYAADLTDADLAD